MIDWSKPLEAYHPDGRVVAVDVVRFDDDEVETTHGAWDKDGTSVWVDDVWRIRNRAPSIPLASEMTLLDYFAGKALASGCLPHHAYDRAQSMMNERAKHIAHAPLADGKVEVQGYVATIPDSCDRFVWRGRYYYLTVGKHPPELTAALRARHAEPHTDQTGSLESSAAADTGMQPGPEFRCYEQYLHSLRRSRKEAG